MVQLTSILLWTIGFLWVFWGMCVLVMGESGWEAVRDAAIARYNEIKAEHPWPVTES